MDRKGGSRASSPRGRNSRVGDPTGKSTRSMGGTSGSSSRAVGDGRDSTPPFPFPSAVLLERGLGMLGFPGADADWASPQMPDVPIALRGSASAIPLFNRYIRELELFNAVFDLVGAEPGTESGRSDLVVRHILDSLAPWKEIAFLAAIARRQYRENPEVRGANPPVEIADVGSGAGFPGIPLAIAFPDTRFTLVERMSKRCAFLENCVAMLGLRNVSVLNVEVEKAPAGFFDIVVFRAFRPLDAAMANALLRLAKPVRDSHGGVLAAWKARKDKIDGEMSAIAGIVGDWKGLPLEVPFLEHEERNLVVISSGKLPYRAC